MESGVNSMRLYKGSMQGRHVLAAILTATMGVLRAGHAVTALHCFIRGGGGEAVS